MGRIAVRVESQAGSRNGMVQVKAFDSMQAKLAEADDLDSTMSAGWEAFQLILLVAYKYGGLKSDAFATWMWALGPASDGSGLLEPGPSHSGSGLNIDQGDLAQLSEDDAARALASLAGDLRDKFTVAALDSRPERVHDARACGQAAEAASELHKLFALDE